MDYVNNNAFRCECPFGFEGHLCENETIKCELFDVLCENAGTCLETEDGMDGKMLNDCRDSFMEIL